jgi:hypothetical protein
MRKPIMIGIANLAVALLLSTHAFSQNQESPKPNYGGPEDLYEKLGDTGTGGAAPKRDLTGFWAGRVAQRLNPIPPLTPWGEEQFRQHKSNEKYPVAESNDPIKGCDPLGFPRNILFMTRGIVFVAMPGKMIEMSEYNRVWREIWTDGRELPKNVGGDTPGAPDPRWYGYSVGHWVDDYTFVVNTVGTDERTWLDNAGHPHSGELRVEERYVRVNHNTLEVTVTIDDPKTYTKPFVITKASFTWIPEQDFEEEICAPSEQAEYLKLIANPAAPSTPSK